MKARKVLNSPILITFFFVFFTFACSKEDDAPFVNQCPDEGLGEFSLLPSSFESIPYTNEKYLFFEDSSKTEWALIIDPEGGNQGYNNSSRNGPCPIDSSYEIYYNFKAEETTFRIYERTDSKWYKMFILYLTTNLDYDDLTIQYDDLSVVKYSRNNRVSNNLTILVDQGGLSDLRASYYSRRVPSITYNNKTFENVYVSDGLGFSYTFEQGIVAFRDSTGKMWTIK